MTLNLRKGIQSTLPPTNLFNQHNKITINQPIQTHFTVQGVQVYSPQQIKMLKTRQEKRPNNKEGTYIQTRIYKIDDQIDFQDQALERKARIKQKMQKRPSTAKVKEDKEAVKLVAKPFKKTAVGKANQNMVKLDKQIEKKSAYQRRLEALAKQYKEHFGDTIKSQKNKKKQAVNESPIQQKEIPEQPIGEVQSGFVLQQEQGEQMIAAKRPSINTKTKNISNDDSFQQVQWQSNAGSISALRNNKSTYSQKLGDAVYKIFDDF